jgi:hypothetical protein
LLDHVRQEMTASGSEAGASVLQQAVTFLGVRRAMAGVVVVNEGIEGRNLGERGAKGGAGSLIAATQWVASGAYASLGAGCEGACEEIVLRRSPSADDLLDVRGVVSVMQT